MQLVLLPEVLGANSGPSSTSRPSASARDLELQSIQDLKSWFDAMMLGELEVELDEEKVLVKLEKCMTCYRLPATGNALCDFERGLVDGVLERITGTDVSPKRRSAGAWATPSASSRPTIPTPRATSTPRTVRSARCSVG